MCNDCRGDHKHYHWLTFRAINTLTDHLRMLTQREDQIASIVSWWADTVELYKGQVSGITGAPLAVAEAWREANMVAQETKYAVPDEARAVAVRAAYWDIHDATGDDAAVMQGALREIRAALNNRPAWPTPPAAHSDSEIRAYLEGEL